jgi:hypothetical protein
MWNSLVRVTRTGLCGDGDGDVDDDEEVELVATDWFNDEEGEDFGATTPICYSIAARVKAA